jgi:NAD(P)-dependent dehydrogenase (short-subunit alcohol dehydrogenase family)
MAAFKELEGKRVFITGAASGIGYEMALAFAREGADIIAADLQQEGLAELAPKIEAIGRKCRQVTLDVTDEAAYANLFSDLIADGEMPDIVINNAGIGVMGSFLETDNGLWKRVLDINVIGVVNGCRAFLTAIGESNKPGLLINVASAASLSPMPNMSAYAASKYAVEGLSEVLAMELADGQIDVMCVHPGVINTAIVKHPELTRVPAEQLARLQAFYAANGDTPASVAQAVVAGVKSGSGTVFAGSGVGMTGLLKRLLSRFRFRRLLISKAREIGYL